MLYSPQILVEYIHGCSGPNIETCLLEKDLSLLTVETGSVEDEKVYSNAYDFI